MSERYDVVVIGGGIHGAGIAQAVAARGATVLLLEQNDIASGTSSKSSKLIHGGLRYLETGQFALVRECLRERATLLRIAPDLVRLVPFHIPVYAHTTRRPWQLHAGLSLYALLGGGGYATVPRRRWDELDALDTRGLQTVFRYFDAQTDDAALTRAVTRSAQSLGAEIQTGARVTHVQIAEKGSEVVWRVAGREQVCSARVVVNASGPWLAATAALFHPPVPVPVVELVQGTHIVIDAPQRAGCFYVETMSDRRAVFVMPWHGRTLVGTTESRHEGDPSQVAPHAEETDYLRRVYAHYFPANANAPVVESFAGLRVLPRAEGSVFARPRETLLSCDRETRPRVITVAGGKLTAYRITADKVVARIAGNFRLRPGRDTRTIALK